MAPEAELVVLKVMLVLMKYLRPEASIKPWEPVARLAGTLGFSPGLTMPALACRPCRSVRCSTIATSAETAVAVTTASRAKTKNFLSMVILNLLRDYDVECQTNRRSAL